MHCKGMKSESIHDGPELNSSEWKVVGRTFDLMLKRNKQIPLQRLKCELADVKCLRGHIQETYRIGEQQQKTGIQYQRGTRDSARQRKLHPSKYMYVTACRSMVTGMYSYKYYTT